MEKLDVNDIFLEKIKTLIYENKNEVLKKELINFHYADIAEIIELISLDEAIYIVKLLESDITAEALAEVDESFREKILNKLSAKEIAEEIESGMVWVNTWLHRDLRVPFGGVKASGVGREGGIWSVGFFSEAINICVKH